ncbi:MAG: MFS transporter [Alphaproteobacteria bacterium]|nr:MFS transporter [Alphaproteobacteria bacterium]
MQIAVPLEAGARVDGRAAERVPTKVVMATVAGNAIEFFDFITYAYFAVYIGQTFFPANTEFMSLLLSVGVFGVGFVFRPLGGVIIGAYADRVGRKPAMLLTIVLITLGTLALALTPSYASIGIAAPIIVVVCRLVQGLALGGEVGPASVFLVEIAPEGKRGLYSSWQLASQGLASLTAGGCGMLLSYIMSPADLAAWGWRVPFVLCLALIPVALYLRSSMPETLRAPRKTAAAPQGERVRVWEHSGFILIAILLIMGATVSTYAANYMTTYAIATLRFPPSTALAATVIAGISTFLFALLGGWLADRYGRRMVMILPRLLLTVVTLPLFLMIGQWPGVTTLYATTIALSGLTAISATAALVAIPELLPRSIRTTGLAIAYAVGVALFGGSTQFIITWLLKVTNNNPSAPAWYITAASLISLIAMFAVPESRDRKLER